MFAWRAFPAEPGTGPGAFLTVPELARRGFRVAFTTRHGGTSEPPFDRLNLSYSSGDEAESVRANRSRACRAVGGSLESWTGARQVHGTLAVRVSTDERGAGAWTPSSTIPGADALWTEEPDVTIVALAADCTPIALVDVEGGRAGVVHAGWRGLVAGVIEETVAAMGDPRGIRAFIGPGIGPCCYEVGSEVADRAVERLGEIVLRPDGRYHLDLWAGSAVALRSAGVREIWPAALCTRCEPSRFYSHRAGARGRQGVLLRIETRGGA